MISILCGFILKENIQANNVANNDSEKGEKNHRGHVIENWIGMYNIQANH